jgi:hypothetical protein
MYEIHNQAGRLVEVRVASPVVVDELAPFLRRLREVLSAMPGKAVICTDLRGAKVFAPEVADGFVNIMRGDNPRLDRSAFLVSDNALFSLQIERMIREAGSSVRRAFHDPVALVEWVGELLGDDERRSLERFLAAG